MNVVRQRLRAERWKTWCFGAVTAWLVTLFAAGAMFAVESAEPSYARTLPKEGTVWTVVIGHVDGDTVRLGSIVDEDTARLLDIDAPETRTKDKIEKVNGEKSAKRLAELLPVNSVWKTEVKGRDGFDRPLVRFFRPDGTTVNRQMIDEGMAKEYKP